MRPWRIISSALFNRNGRIGEYGNTCSTAYAMPHAANALAMRIPMSVLRSQRGSFFF